MLCPCVYLKNNCCVPVCVYHIFFFLLCPCLYLKNQVIQKVDPEEENTPTAPAGIRTRDLSVMSPAL